ncbi:extracellular solute-binding protein [Cohnella endophytica]|uniref:Extracellular solute-binding protein n=1 Tax=Cohnella endophytica TaxID=2419778 RepID=A0A494Y8R2_9BACL|nr:extracellular solute-binding protein [Cohnella endophytica]RKP56272.1 extracellular solute-binding protein [Cohnella endophytica]
MKAPCILKNRLKDVASIVLVIVLSSVISSCSPLSQNKSESNNSAVADAKNKVTIKFWAWGLSPEDFKPMLQRFEDTHPNIGVDLSVMPSLEYQQKLPISLSMHEDLDVVGMQPGMVGSLSDYLMDLDPLFRKDVGEDWLDQIKTADLKMMKQNSSAVTAVPIGDSASMMLYYNNELLTEIGLKEPSTYEDLKTIVNTLRIRKPDILPLAVGAKEGWILDEIVLTIASQKSDLYNKIRYKQGGKWDSEEYKDAVRNFKTMIDDNVISKDSADMDDTRALSLFTTGKAAMYVQGSWQASMLSSKYKEANKIPLKDVGLTALPLMYPEGKPAVRAYLDYELSISKDSRHPEEAEELLKYFTLGEGANEMGNIFFVVPSKIGFQPDKTDLLTDTAKNSYQKLQDLIANATVDRNNLSSFSDYVGKQLQRVMLTNANIDEMVQLIQKEFDAGKYVE